jgi:1,4-dihydroxy-2-naphthoate octaprenyltransferase
VAARGRSKSKPKSRSNVRGRSGSSPQIPSRPVTPTATAPAWTPTRSVTDAPPAKAAPAAVAVQPRRATARDWIGGARLRTLPLALAPVAIGTGAAYAFDDDSGWHWVRALLCLAVAVCLQIGVNFANDYSDGIRGTDEHRVGPSRLTGSGAARPRAVLAVAIAFFAVAGVAGVLVSVLSGHPWLIAVGAVAIVAAYFYTGGTHPYGYYALGEVFVFVFFGLVAVAGTMFVQVDHVSAEAWLAGVAIGLLACAVLMVNNIRDARQDRLAGKRTLAVLLGDTPSRIIFTTFALVPFGILGFLGTLFPHAFYVFFALLAVVPAAIITLTGRTAREFILALQLTSLTALVFGLGLGAAFAF